MAKCVPCLSKEAKDALISITNNAVISQQLQEVETCPVGEFMNFCTKKKRAKSAYQLFVSDCMKSKKIKQFGEASTAMKECAIEWKKRKN
jgi:hypothetical protein